VGNGKILILIIVIAFITLILAALTHSSEEGMEYKPVKPRIVDHSDFFRKENITRYEGSRTCMKCHLDEVYEFFHSYHYQMANKVNDIVGRGEVLFGGKYAYNDYCGAIFWMGLKPVNYIGKAVLKKPPEGYERLKGKFIASGCSMCHGVSMGLPPSSGESDEQLGNIDCIACHIDPKIYLSGPIALKKGLKEVYVDENGVWRYRLNPDKI